MSAQAPTTPLISLDAVVLDTETTGLDPAKARIVQLGAILIRHGDLIEESTLSQLVDPGEPIPQVTTRVHGLDDAAIKGAPRFAAAMEQFARFRGDRLVIGHNIGFDLAMMKRECGLAGLPFAMPAALDTRLLGEFCFPRLAGFTLDKLAAHLGVDLHDRHDALADARATARLFLALLPHLRERGVRTLGEAENACRGLSRSLEGYAKAGWVEPVVRTAAPEGALARIDAYPFRHRVRDVMSAPPITVPPDATLAATVAMMTERRISSVFVVEDVATARLADIGILTERDVMRALARLGADALAASAADVASRPLATVPADAFIYRAIGRMDRRRIRHLGVEDEHGRLVGAISQRDLLRLRASDALALGDQIDSAETTPALAAAWGRMPEVARRLLAEGVSARDVAAVVSREMGALTRRAAVEAENHMIASGRGPAPRSYVVLVLGSAGRGESLLAPDQDNALVWDDGEAAEADGEAVEAWFAPFAERMAATLDEIGVPLCKGGVMARNPAFRGSLATWRARVGAWLTKTRPEDLLAVDIFYDFRAVHGDAALARTLWDDAHAAAHCSPLLAKLLAAEIKGWRPPFGFFGGFQLVDGRVDLKKGGLFPIVAAARCLSLRHGLALRSTPERIAAARAARIGADRDLEAWDRAHGALLDALLTQQLADIAAGRRPSNLVDPSVLPRADADALKAALGKVSAIATTVRDLLFSDR